MAESIPNESALDFIDYPNRFPVKVFGNQADGFEDLVVDLIKKHCQPGDDIEVSRRESKAGNYQSLTVTFTAHNRQQIENIYRDLHECEQVLMSL